MPEVLSVTEARGQLTELTGRVRFAGERILLKEHGKTVAALVSPSDVKALEALEDRLDLLDALDALADYQAHGGKTFETLKADLGLS